MAPPPKGDCASCGQRTAKHCTRCAEGVDMDGNRLLPTFYCSTDCQKADFAEHKASCQSAAARQQLYRGGELLQQVFYAFRETCFDLSISQVDSEGSKLRVFLNYYDRNGPVLFSFPDHLVPDSNDKNAILTHLACSEVLIYLSQFVQSVFKDITSRTHGAQEATVFRKQMPPVIELVDGNGIRDDFHYSHQFIVITLKNRESYVIDAAGAQYRQYSPVKPRATYDNAYVLQYEQRNQLGHFANKYRNNRVQHHPLTNLPGGFSDHDRILAAGTEVVKGMNAGINAWESKAGKSVSELLKEKQINFEVDRKEFLATVQQNMRDSIDAWKSTSGNVKPL